MSFRSSTPFDLPHESVLCQKEFDENFFDQYLNLDDGYQIDEASILEVVPRSPQLATAPSPSHSQASGFEPTSYPSHRFSRADSDIDYWSNYSRPPSPVGIGRSKTLSEHQLLSRRRPDSGAFELEPVAYHFPPIYTLDSSPPSPTSYKPVTSSPHNFVQQLRRKKSFSNRSVSSFLSAREPSRERDPRRSARSVSRSAIRKQSSPPKMSKLTTNAYQASIEEWNAKFARQAQQFDFGFDQPISPPPSARVSDASSSESTKMRTKALTHQRKLHQQQQQQLQLQQQQQQTEQWQNQQYAVVRDALILTPLTTPKYNEASIHQNHNASFMSQSSQWTVNELQDMDGSFVDMSFVVDGADQQWWEEPAQLSEQETSPVVLSHNESFPQSMAISPISSRNTKQLQIALPSNDQRPDWPTIDTNVDNTVDVDLTISPGVRPTPIALTNANNFAGHVHTHTQSPPNIGNSMLLQPHVSVPTSPSKIISIPDGGEPSPLRHRESGSYFSNVAPPPVPAYLQSQQASPLLSHQGSPMRLSKSRQRQLEEDHSAPPSRSVSPASFSQSFSQSFPNALGMGMHNASTPNFSTPHPHPYSLSARKSRILSHKASEPSFASHHQRGRSSLVYGYLPQSNSQSFPQPSGSPSPRILSQSRAKMHTHARSKSSNNLGSNSGTFSSSKRSSSKKGKEAPVSMEVEFHNYTPRDGSRILSGVAPSGSSKTKARREKEAKEKQRRLSQLAMQAVRDLGGDPHNYMAEGLDSDTNGEGGSGDDVMEVEELNIKVEGEFCVI